MPKYMQYQRFTAYTYTECIAMAWFEAHNILAKRCRFSHTHTSFPLQSLPPPPLPRWICFCFFILLPCFIFSVFATVCHQILSMMCCWLFIQQQRTLRLRWLVFVFVSHIYNTDFVISLPPFSLSLRFVLFLFNYLFVSLFGCTLNKFDAKFYKKRLTQKTFDIVNYVLLLNEHFTHNFRCSQSSGKRLLFCSNNITLVCSGYFHAGRKIF